MAVASASISAHLDVFENVPASSVYSSAQQPVLEPSDSVSTNSRGINKAGPARRIELPATALADEQGARFGPRENGGAGADGRLGAVPRGCRFPRPVPSQVPR
jgi:hypothetical protein